MLRTETKLEHLAESISCSPALGRGSTPLQRGERMSYNLFVILLSKLWVVFLWTMSISILQPMECPIKVILQEGLSHQTFYVLFTSFDKFFIINDHPRFGFKSTWQMLATKGQSEPTYVQPESKIEKVRPVFEVKFPRGFIARHLFFEGVSSFSW